jgi:UDP-N-acetylmuramate dehydrogenase
VRDAIIAIRMAKLPDPAVFGNAGSFFKNPVISSQQAAELKSQFPSIIMYPLEDGTQKVAAGWLIEHAGWKGFRRGDAGVHPNQALCLINYGSATGKEILDLATDIKNSVFEKFQIHISPEVRIV